MKNLKIGKKLLVTFGIIILFFLVTVVVSILSLISTGDKFTQFYEGPYQVTNKASDLRTSIQATGKYIGYASMTDDQAKTAEYVQGASNELQTLRDGVVYMRENFSGELSLIDSFESVMSSVNNEREQVLNYALSNQNAEAAELYFSKVMPAFIQGQDYLTKINDSANGQAETFYRDSQRQMALTTALLCAISILTLAATTFIGLYITRSLKKPIQELESAANQMAEGSLDVKVQYQSKDELGSLSESMRKMSSRISFYMGEITKAMGQLASGDLDVKAREHFVGDFLPVQMSIRQLVGSLNSTLSQINQAADQVSGGSDQVSSGAQALSQGATEQASSIEELAATINEISSQVNKNADDASAASRKAAEVGGHVMDSNQRMQQMTDAMREISDKSQEISKIIKTIEDIAFQTNILALNAAVEAARAGAAGKGFAVVADEVRNLASKSADASKNTSALIEGTVLAVENGTKIADSTAAQLLQVVEGAKQIVSTIDGIAEASRQQAASIVQVTAGVDQISSVVQTNSATAEESAAASEELTGQAQMLKDLVGQFRLKSQGGSAPSIGAPLAEASGGAFGFSQDKY